MRVTFSKKQIVLLIFTFVIGGANMFIKPSMEGFRAIFNLNEDNIFHSDKYIYRVVLLNYMLILHYMIMFVILTVFIVLLVRLCIRSAAFLSLYREGQHGKVNDLTDESELEKMLLIDKFEAANDLVWTIDAFAIAVLVCMVSALFCTMNDYFRGIKLWAVDPARAGRYSFFPAWVFEVFTVPNADMSDYAITWLLPMFVFIIVFAGFTYYKFYKAKKAFCSVFPDVPNERVLEPLIILKRQKKKHFDEPLYSEDYSSINKQEANMFLRQEDIDGEENVFFAEEISQKEKIPFLESMTEGEPEENDDQELIPDELDLSRLKLQPKEQEKGENLIPCPLCGSLNPENAEECCFCGGIIDK